MQHSYHNFVMSSKLLCLYILLITLVNFLTFFKLNCLHIAPLPQLVVRGMESKYEGDSCSQEFFSLVLKKSLTAANCSF